VKIKQSIVVAATVATLSATSYAAVSPADIDFLKKDFGSNVDSLLRAVAPLLVGFTPIRKSAIETAGPYRLPNQAAAGQVRIAQGLNVQYLTRNAADSTDMMAFFPQQHPTHLISCVESDLEEIAPGKLNPSVQRINLATGAVETILRGLNGCDGIRSTAWGTILATEENDDGGAYEILEPLNVTNQTVINRATGETTDPLHIGKRTALPTIAWEGIAILPSGVVIAGDELRPGTDVPDSDGGAIFKFIPSTPFSGSGAIATLGDSPLTSGSVYAMQVSCQPDIQQFGQGCEVGHAAWIPVNAATARIDADSLGATGYYRPEDLHQDPAYRNPDVPEAVRVCWTDTGNEGAFNYAEVACAVESSPLTAIAEDRTVVVNRFIEGDTDFNSFDNLDFQPRSGILYVIEDHPNGDIFACLRDGKDRDLKSDGCVKLLSVKDSSAEPTGFIFAPNGRTAYLSIQHSDDTNVPEVDDYGTDDVLKITGFQLPQ
jgi:secreted PhoX family phosphatase